MSSQRLPHVLCGHPIPQPWRCTKDCDSTEKQGCTVSPTSLHSTRTILHLCKFEFCICYGFTIVNKIPTSSFPLTLLIFVFCHMFECCCIHYDVWIVTSDENWFKALANPMLHPKLSFKGGMM